MKKILLIIDTPNRDLKGIELLTYQIIAKHGHFPIITTTGNELPMLIRYKPDLIILPHVRYAERHKPIVEFAQSQNTKIAILSVEGMPANYAVTKERILDASLAIRTIVGVEQFYHMIDLLLTWGHLTKELLEEKPILRL